jgi:hypothetical protein
MLGSIWRIRQPGHVSKRAWPTQIYVSK